MKQLTQEKCREIISELSKQNSEGTISIVGEYSLQAFRSAAALMQIMGGHVNVLAEVVAERQRQIEKGYNAGNDDNYENDELAAMAVMHVMPRGWKDIDITKYEWASLDDGMVNVDITRLSTDRRVNLIRGIAMLVAEVERYDRNEGLENPVG
ncbi:MAG: hypothetical protein E5Y74_00075 [Mesorhizobium sp.]|nr:MAG: hypothetical protein E5Y74_00075 [Mesorhizobium sp.]